MIDSSWMDAIARTLGLLGAGAIVYASLCLILAKIQTGLVFRPLLELKHTPADYGLDYREVWIPVVSAVEPEGVQRLHGWWIGKTPPQRADRVVLYFHGNFGNIGTRLGLDRIAAFHRTWSGAFFMVDYRGFGRSVAAPPSEAKLYEDLDAIWTYLTQTEGIAAQRIVVYGHSLGGAAAIEFGRRHPQVGALVIDSSFTAIGEVAKTNPIFRLFPIERILQYRFRSIDNVATLTMPTLFIHGTADTVVPSFMSEKLYAATPEPKTLCLLPGVGHKDVLERASEEFLTAIAQFLDAEMPSLM